MKRKLVLLAAVTTLAVGAFATSAFAASYVFRDGTGNPAQGGKFGTNIQLRNPVGAPLSLTVPTGATSVAENDCDGWIGGQITANDPAATLKAMAPAHTFANCSLAPTFAAGNWALTVMQGQSGAGGVYKAKVGGVDLLLPLGGSTLCEYKGTVPVTITNGSPTTIAFNNAKINLFTGTGTFTTAGCPPFGTANGTLIPEAVTGVSPTPNNITIG